MKIRMFPSLITVLTLSVLWSAANAEVPGLINHQGYLTDDAGVPIDGDREMWFLFYDQEIGGSETWSEGPTTVPVTGGVFHVLLGQINPITPADLAGPRWLEVIVDSEYMEPRERIVSGPFAIEAENADTVDGMEAAALEESAEIDSDIAAHGASASAHHTKTASFTELTDSATDAQVPNTITIDYAATAGDADTLDGVEAAALEETAEIEFEIVYHASKVSAHHTKTTTFVELTGSVTDAQVPDDITVNYAAAAGDAATLDGQDSSAFADASYVAALEARIAALEALLAGVTRAGDDITFSGSNVHIVSGSGATDGAVNGRGNLIVGYNESRGATDDRTGSHNIVVGSHHNYSSFGGLVAGRWNTISGDYASVSGGTESEASGSSSSVSGGHANMAIGTRSSVSGGPSIMSNNADFYRISE